MTWQNTRLSHVKKILGLNTKGVDFEIKVPAISYNLLIAQEVKKYLKVYFKLRTKFKMH